MWTGRRSISLKLGLVLSGTAMVATGLALWMQDRSLARDLERAAVARLERAAQAADLLVASHLEAMSERYHAVSGTPQFRANLEVGDAATLTYYAQQLARREGVARIAFEDSARRVIAEAGAATLASWPGLGERGLVADRGRALAVVKIPLETAGLPLGQLVAVEPVSAPLLRSWSSLCGADVRFAAAPTRGAPHLERVVRRLPGGLELRVIGSLDAEREALANSRRSLLAAGIVAIGLAMLGGGLLSRSLVSPILSIQAATERIARGDFEVRIGSRRRDEIGDVARAFDAMLERLRSYLEELRRSRERLESAQRLARIGSWQLDLQSGELTGSAEFHHLLGLEVGEPEKALPHSQVLERIHPEEREEFARALRLSLSQGVDLYLDNRVALEGEERILHTQARLLETDANGGRRLEGTVQDVTDRRRTEQQIRFLAYHDALTGLGNRDLFSERLELALSRARRNDACVGVLFLDLDHFKRINDTLGHSAGDQLLRRVADRLVMIVRDSDLVAHDRTDFDSAVSRLGGDEFTLLLTDVEDPRNLAKVAQRILAALARPFGIQGHEVFVGCSIGITSWPMDGDDVESLLRNADTAMYHAKDHGRNHYQFYTESMNAEALRRLTLEQKLRRAIEENELELHYQPKISLADGSIRGFEALLRWRDPEIGTVLPGDFIPIAEETGLIVAIGEWVLREACRQISTWDAADLPRCPIAVNLSAQQFRNGHLAELVSRILDEAGVSPDRIQIEITESTLVADDASVVRELEALRARGVRVAIDDFGTGFSSLAYLRRLPVDILKIDRSFVSDIARDGGDAALVAAIVSMGRALQLELVAEGVETDEQRELLASWGCDEFQGFRFSPAVPASDVLALWQRAGGR